MEFHEIANVFPLLSNEELEALAADIAENGLHHPITTYQGKILDGRNRYVACELANVEPKYSEYTGDNPIAFVTSENLQRRHLDASQRGMIGARLANMRQGDNRFTIDRPIGLSISQSDAADLLGVSVPTIKRAKTVLDDGIPELVKAVADGTMAVSQAAQIARLPEPEQRKAIEQRPHVANNSGNNEWYTPREYIDAARVTMGGIDCDPATSELANKSIGAGTYYTIDDNGLEQVWTGRVWLNPPYAQPLVAQFCDKLAEQIRNKITTEACVLVNNATDTGWFHTLLELAAAVCFIKGRVRFIDTNGVASGAPLQGQAILYFGENIARFADAFSTFGKVLYAR